MHVHHHTVHNKHQDATKNIDMDPHLDTKRIRSVGRKSSPRPAAKIAWSACTVTSRPHGRSKFGSSAAFGAQDLAPVGSSTYTSSVRDRSCADTLFPTTNKFSMSSNMTLPLWPLSPPITPQHSPSVGSEVVLMYWLSLKQPRDLSIDCVCFTLSRLSTRLNLLLNVADCIVAADRAHQCSWRRQNVI